jgi:DNA mismatch repair protein MutL
MITRSSEEQNGTIFKTENAQTLLFQHHGAPRGTVITVEELFRNVPARLKFLKTPGAESAHIAELVHAYALAYPHVRFSLVNDGKLLFQAPGSGKLLDALTKVFGGETARAMLPIASSDSPHAAETELAAPSVSGYITPPTIHRGNRRLQYIFVNGRWIEDRALGHAVIEAYHTMLMVGRFPLFVLNIHLPAEAVDVNVHPTKMQVRFREPGEVYRAVQRTVRRALNENFPVPSITPSSPFSAQLDHHSASSASAALNLIPPDNGSAAQSTLANVPESSWSGSSVVRHPSAVAIPILRVIGQIASTYIICEGPDGLYLVDQHAAHERVLYEKWMSERELLAASQNLLDPVTIELSPAQWSVYESERENLERAGFGIEPFGGQTILLRAIPVILDKQEPRRAFLEILDMTDEGGNPIQAAAEARLIMSICKGAAIKGGQVMAGQEMRALIHDLEKTNSPRTCPHGRPTMIQLNTAMLEREFGRRG